MKLRRWLWKGAVLTGTALLSPQAYGFFDLSYTISDAAAFDVVDTCATGTVGRATDPITSQIGECGTARSTAAFDEDATGYGAYGEEIQTIDLCEWVDYEDVNDDNVDAHCFEEPVALYNADGKLMFGFYRVAMKKANELIWKVVEKIKAKQSRRFARLDEWCVGHGGALESMLAWKYEINNFDLCSAYNYCDTKFSASNVPACNEACDAAFHSLCSTDDNPTDPTDPPPPDDAVCGTFEIESGFEQDWCDTVMMEGSPRDYCVNVECVGQTEEAINDCDVGAQTLINAFTSAELCFLRK